MKKLLLHSLLIVAASMPLYAQTTVTSPEDQERIRLVELPNFEMRFEAAPLSQALRTLAEASDLAFIGLPASEAAGVLVDMTVRGNPFKALEMLSANYGYEVVFEDGLWHFEAEKASRTQLTAEVYTLVHIQLDDIQTDSSLTSSSASGDMTSSVPQSINTNAFEVSGNKIITEIKKLLALDPAKLAIVSTSGELMAGDDAHSNSEYRMNGRVIADSDHNKVYVIATKAHHKWIKAYLEAVDHPRKLIQLDTRFIEVRKSPKKEVGMDWSAALAGGYGFNIQDAIDGATGGFDTNLFTEKIGGTILSGPELNLSLHMLEQDSNSQTLQHPSQITVNNRQVVLRNVMQQPFESGSSTNNNGGSSSSTSSTEYIPIGTTISVLPRILTEENVELNILLNVSDLLGWEEFQTGDSDTTRAPITTSRDYAGQAIVATGNTLAIGGLETLVDSEAETKVPFLGDLPLFGMLFNKKSRELDNTKLIMMITATILDTYKGGIQTPEQIQEFIEFAEQIDETIDEEGSIKAKEVFNLRKKGR